MFLMTTCPYTYVCLCIEEKRPKESKKESTTDSNFSFVNQGNKRKLRLLPFSARKLRITVTYTHAVMTDKLNCWGHVRSVQTFPLSPTVRSDTLGDAQEILQIEVEAVKIANAHQLREGPQDSQGQDMNGSGLPEGAWGRSGAALVGPGCSPHAGVTCCQIDLDHAGENGRGRG